MQNEDAQDTALIPKPWWKSRTVWSAVIAFILAVPSLVEGIAPFLTPEQRTKALALAALAASIGTLFARKGGVDASSRVVAAVVTAQAGKLLPGVLAALGDKLEAHTDDARATPPTGTRPARANRPPRSAGDDGGRFDG